MTSQNDQLSEDEKNQSCLDMIIEEPIEKKTETVENEILMKCERSKSLDLTHLIDLKQVKYRVASLMSLGDWDGAITLQEDDDKPGRTKL